MTHAERSIRHCLAMLAPCRPIETADAQFSAGDYRVGQRQFHDRMAGLYRRMLADPEGWLIPVTPYEHYAASHPPRPEAAPHRSDSRESTLRNAFQQAISFYAEFLYALGCAADDLRADGAMAVPAEKYDAILQKLSRRHDGKRNALRIERLQAEGLALRRESGTMLIRWDRAALGLHVLCRAPEGRYSHMNFLRVDYPSSLRGAPTLDDVLESLPAACRQRMRSVLDAASELPLKPRIKPLRGIVSDFRWKVDFLLGGRCALGFTGDCDGLNLYLHFNAADSISRFSETLAGDPALLEWFRGCFPERLCRCPNNRMVDLGGEARRICGLSNRAEIVNPDDGDIQNAIRILQKFRQLPENAPFA